MLGLKEATFFALILVCIVEGAKRNAQCDLVCQRKMTIECCECIGCHQGMRFGKRSQPFNGPDFEEASLAAREVNAIEEAIAELELELVAISAARAQSRPASEKFNH